MGLLTLLYIAAVATARGNFLWPGVIRDLGFIIMAVFMWRVRQGVQQKFSRVPGMLALKPIVKLTRFNLALAVVLITHIIRGIVNFLWGFTLPEVYFGAVWVQSLCTVLGGYFTVAVLEQKRDSKRCPKSSEVSDTDTTHDMPTSMTARDTSDVELGDVEMQPRAVVEGEAHAMVTKVLE